MKNKYRAKIIYINTIVAFAGQIFQILISFVVRKAFITTLDVAYLGYNSVFSNILQMLNLADLGIGVAITSFLYKPLAESDTKKNNALMYIYGKIYSIMGLVVLCIGIIISLFIGYLIPDSTTSIDYLRLLFYINLGGTVSTYFLAYKRTLIIADQKSYLTNIVDTVVSILISIAQVICLICWPNYIVYLALNIAKAVISNIILSLKSDKLYGRIKSDVDKELINEYKLQIIQYVKDVFISRVGAVIYFGTDNVIISVLRGSLLAGYLSNYTMITGYLTTVINQVLVSLQATFGNYINSDKTIVEQQKMTDNYFFANFLVGNFCMACFMFLSQDFISIYFGKKLLLSFSTAMWLGINLMLTLLMQLPSQVFTIYKLFKYDRPFIIVSAGLNIIISVVLVKQIGIDGALIGTCLTSLIYLFSRFYIISKKVYIVYYSYYVKNILMYFATGVVCSLITYYSTKGIIITGWFFFIIKAMLVGLIAFLSSCAILFWKKEFQFLVNKLVPTRMREIVKPIPIVVAALICIICSFLIGGTSVADVNTSNKSLKHVDTYTQEQDYAQRIFHFSIDDTIEAFIDISNNKYESVFQNELFAWLKTLHDQYGLKTTCFVYYEGSGFSLSDCTDRFKSEFETNSSWLRFGFHTRNGNTTYESV